MSVGFDFQTKEGVLVREIGVENDGVQFFSLCRRIDNNEYIRMRRADLLEIKKEAQAIEPVAIAAQKQQVIQLGFL